MRNIALIALYVLIEFTVGCGRNATDGDRTPAQAAVLPLTNMIFINAGTYLRQGNLATISNEFWLGKFEVSQAEFLAVTGKNPSHFAGKPNCPVEKVSFNEASAYCARLTERERQAGRISAAFEYRLPWEAEWEYACLAGSTNRFSWGNSPTESQLYAWTAENSGAMTHPRGEKGANAWGFYDMHGNVWEWCLDSYVPEPGKPAPPHAGKFKIFKGGGWNQDAEYAGVVNRFMMSPSNGIHFVGFRVALARTAK